VNLEDRLRAALERMDAYPPSPDLFARVTRTLEEDALHLRRVRRTVLGTLGWLVALAGWFVLTSTVDEGRALVPGWSLEAAVTAVLIVLVWVLGPTLRRYGERYLVGALGRGSAHQFAGLLDLAYYLVAAGYVLLTGSLLPDVLAVPVGAEALERAARRIGGLAVVLGVLHALTLMTLPLVGLLLRSIRWRTTPGPAADPHARAADRAALGALAVLGAGLALAVALAVVLVAIVGSGP
jgi:hypothetical protein